MEMTPAPRQRFTMPSLFPGMDPYLEQSDTWEDFHNAFIVHARNALARQVGKNYLIQVETRLYVRELSEDERLFRGKADVAVVQGGGSGPRHPGGSAVLTAPTMELYLPEIETIREPFLEIHDRRDRRLVTVLELLS